MRGGRPGGDTHPQEEKVVRDPARQAGKPRWSLPRRILVLLWALATASPAGAADEIHWTLTGQTSVTFDWRGTSADLGDNTLRYGLAPGTYTTTVTAVPPSPYPDSSAGPFWEARLTGLQEDTLYYYQIANEPEATFRTSPPRGSADFWMAEEADIGSTLAYPLVGPTQSQIAADNPNIPGDDRPRFVLVPGDLTYGDDKGTDDVDQHFNDVMVWSRWAAYMPAWGNHEWDDPTDPTIEVDDMQNYEGRFDFPNSQTPPNAPARGGPGEDWYWFDYGNVRFIAYPEPYTGAWSDWKTKVDPIMAAAQGDPKITFIVTFGHRPPYSSGLDHPGSLTLAGHMRGLHNKYRKYVLNLAAHSHHYERSDPSQTDGIVHIVGAGGGATLGSLSSPQPGWSAYRINHLAHLKLHFTANKIEGFVVCGPAGGGNTDTCTQDTVIDTWSINETTPPAPSQNLRIGK